MFNKSKYDIMKKDMKNAELLVISLFFKLFRLNAIKKKISEEQMDMELCIIIDDALPLMKKVAHIGYENSKDIETVDKQKLLEYVQKKGINPTLFAYNYAKAKEQMAQVLMFFALLDRGNIQFPSFKYPKMVLKILNGEDIKKVIVDILDGLSDETKDALSDLFDNEFKLSNLSEENAQLLEDYHNRYMTENIYSKVTKEVTTEKEIIKIAKLIGKKKFEK